MDLETPCIGTIPKDEIQNAVNEDYVEIEIPFDLFQYLSSSECNIQSVCRICLSPNNSVMFGLLSTKDSNVLTEMFTALTSIQVFREDGLPAFICESCQTQVVHCYEFKSKCEKSDYALKSVLKGEFISKTEKIYENDIEPNETTKEIFPIDIEIKEETELQEDIQYLENLEDIANDNLHIVQNTAKRKKKKLDITITDSNSLLIEYEPGKKNKYLTCTFCSKKFHKAKTLHDHINKNHGSSKGPYGCEQCNQSFNSEHDLLVHSALHSKGSTWSCNQCHKEFNAKSTLRRHIQRHMESKPFSCETCGKMFVEMYALRRHVRVHTGETVEKKHACHLCDKRYSENSQLAVHIARHSGLRPCTCTVCGKSFPTPRHLASHRLVHNDDKPYPCLYCDKRFRHESTRNTHHRTHTGEKPYVCSFCGKTFIQNSNLTLHMRTHTGERPYSCNKCDRKFTSGSSLKAHERTHTGERPYSCNICGKRFARMNMNAHMRLHTGERPHACGACHKTFVSAWRLRDHERMHTGERPFECAICSKKFPSRSHLVKHIKTHQMKRNKVPPRDLVIVQNNLGSIDTIGYKDKPRTKNDQNSEETSIATNDAICETISNRDLETQEIPMEVSGELVLQDDSNNRTELLVVDNSKPDANDVCLNGISAINNDINYSNDVNLVTLNEGGVSITSAAMLEGSTVKLYQLDQSLVQIHSSGGQVTISKITSKMTANF